MIHYIKCPTTLFELFYSKNLSHREIKVLSYLIRQIVGWNKESFFTKKTSISEKIGLHLPHVGGTLKSLESKKLIQITKHVAKIEIKLNLELLLNSNENLPKKEPKLTKRVTKTYQKSNQKTDKMPASKGKQRLLYNNTLNNTLLNAKSERFKNYLKSIKSKRKLEKELRSLDALIEDGFTLQEIEIGFDLLVVQGMPEQKGKMPHTPVTWLSLYIEELSDAIQKKIHFTKIPPTKTTKPIKKVEFSKFEEANLLFSKKHPSKELYNEKKEELVNKALQNIENSTGANLGPNMQEIVFRTEVINWFEQQQVVA